MVSKVVDYFKARWTEISTKIGIILSAISTIAGEYQGIDHRFAYAGAAAGFLLILYKEKTQ